MRLTSLLSVSGGVLSGQYPGLLPGLLLGLFLTFSAQVPFSGVVFAADELTPAQRGRGKAQMCTRCHGRLGLARAAQERGWESSVESFIAGNMYQFRAGKRLHAVMNAVAKPMSDLDIADVAAWYEKVSGFNKKDQ